MTDKLTCKMSDGTEWEVLNDAVVSMDEHWNMNQSGYKIIKPIKREPREFRIEMDSITGNIIGCGYYTPTPVGPLKGREIIKVREVIE